MSAGVDPTAAGLPIVGQALEPEWVRQGSSATKKAYDSALAFEEMLVEQLSHTLTQTGGVGAEGAQEGSEEEGTQAGAGELSSLLPQALTGGVMRAGGLGLAAQMTHELAGLASTGGGRAQEATTTGAVAAPGLDNARSVDADAARGAASRGGTSAP